MQFMHDATENDTRYIDIDTMLNANAGKAIDVSWGNLKRFTGYKVFIFFGDGVLLTSAGKFKLYGDNPPFCPNSQV